MFVPLAAKKPSLGCAGGSRSSGTRFHVLPSSVMKMTKWPSIVSLTAMPCVASQKDIASRKTFGS